MVELYQQDSDNGGDNTLPLRSDTCQNVLSALEIRLKILTEIQQPFPDFDFLYSPIALRCAGDVMLELLEQERAQFNELLKKDSSTMTFDDLYPYSLLGYYSSLLVQCQRIKNDSEIRKVWNILGKKYRQFIDRKEYSKQYYKLHFQCLENPDTTEEQKLIIERKIQEFELRGVQKTTKKQQSIKSYGARVGVLRSMYENNLIDGKKRLSLTLQDDCISEMPQDEKEIARTKALDRGLEGYLFDNTSTSRKSVLQYCTDSRIRRMFFNLIYQDANSGKHDNTHILLKILDLRYRQAKQGGFDSYMDYRFSCRVATDQQEVIDVLHEVSQRAQVVGSAQLSELRDTFSIDSIQAHDLDYYLTKLQREKEGFDIARVNKYFEFENVLQSMFDIAEILFNIKVQKTEIRTYDENVKVYEVLRDEELISYFLTDYFKRDKKRTGALSCVMKGDSAGGVRSIVNIASFTKSSNGGTYLSLLEVQTLFHEFGHALHNILTDTNLSQLYGNTTERDFIEVPSMLFENWCRHHDIISIIAHAPGVDSLSGQDINSLVSGSQSQKWREILTTIQISFIDLEFHSNSFPRTPEALQECLRRNYRENSVFPVPKNYETRSNFSHIINGAYPTGYYGYLWSEIMEKDIWTSFLEKGDLFDPELSQRLNGEILSQGSKKSGAELFRNFRGRDPDIRHFLESELPL